MRLATMMPRINPIKLPSRLLKGTLFIRLSNKRARPARRSPPRIPHHPAKGDGEKAVAKW
jgi:hypothetical protein